jgi:hypothetical protein
MLDSDDKQWIANQLEGFETRLRDGLADAVLQDTLRRLSALEERVRKLEEGR